MAYNNNRNNKQFNLNNYETVKSRKVRLKTDHPNSFILPFPMSDINFAGNYILMGALIWKDKQTFDSLSVEVFDKMASISQAANPQNAGVTLASLAVMTKADGAGFSLSMAGGKGADQNAWVENAEESAVGRALDNMGYHSGSASQEEMKKVEHMQNVQQQRVSLENQINSMYTSLLGQGHNPNYISQVISQSVKSFTQLNELSIDELEKLLNGLQNANGQGAYQTQRNQPVGMAPSMIPGAPAPLGV